MIKHKNIVHLYIHKTSSYKDYSISHAKVPSMLGGSVFTFDGDTRNAGELAGNRAFRAGAGQCSRSMSFARGEAGPEKALSP